MKLLVLFALFLISCTVAEKPPTRVIIIDLSEDDTPNEYYCEKDKDCVAEQCCHPTSTINRNFEPRCLGIVCKDTCDGPLECGAGKVACINNTCTIK